MISGRRYVVAVSAYSPHARVVTPFKKPQGKQLSRDREVFNYFMTNMGVCIEHSISIFKARFQLLRCIRVHMTSASGMKLVVALIERCVVLHNMCIDDARIDEWTDVSEEETSLRSDDGEANESVSGTRREELR